MEQDPPMEQLPYSLMLRLVRGRRINSWSQESNNLRTYYSKHYAWYVVIVKKFQNYLLNNFGAIFGLIDW